MSISSLFGGHARPTHCPAASAAASANAASIASSAANPAGATGVSAGAPASGPAGPVQQLSSELQSFLLQLQGGGTDSGPAGTQNAPGASGTTSAPTSGATAGAGSAPTAHGHHHHRKTETNEAGASDGDAGSAAPASGAGQPGATSEAGSGFVRSLAADIAKALQSYGGVAGTVATPSTAAAQSAALAVAA